MPASKSPPAPSAGPRNPLPKSAAAWALALLLFCGGFEALAADYSHWMTDHWTRIQGKTLRDLVIPGTHDSGAYDLVNPWEVWDSRWYKIEPEFGGADTDEKASKYVNAGPFFEDWSQTQSKRISEQLKGGIRALDLRVAVDSKGRFRAVHSLLGDTIDEILDDIATFTQENPGELIHVRFDHFHDFGLRTSASYTGGRDRMRGSKHEELRKLISEKLGDRLIPDWTPTKTLAELRAPGSIRRILLFYNATVDSDGSTIPRRTGFISNPTYAGNNDWVGDTKDNESPDKFKALTLAKINSFAQQQQLHRLGAVTPTSDQYDAWYQGGDFGGTNPKTLKGYAEDTNPVIARWIRDEWFNKKLNIIHMDFFPDYLVPLCLKLNGIPVENFTIPEDDDWGDYKTLGQLVKEGVAAAGTWIKTAAADVGDWFTSAWTDVSSFFTSVGTSISGAFNQSFEPALAGTPPAGGVQAGVRHYVVHFSRIEVLSAGDDAGGDLELYGQVFMVPSAFASTDPGANKTLWSIAEGDSVAVQGGRSLTVNASKNLYVKEGDAGNLEVALGGVVIDNDDSFIFSSGDDEMKLDTGIRSGPLTFRLGGLEEGRRTAEERVEYVKDAKGRVALYFWVERRFAPRIPVAAPLIWPDQGIQPLLVLDRRNRPGTGLLQASSPIAGRIEYTPSASEFLPPGRISTIRARLIPADSTRYLPSEISREVFVVPVFRQVPSRIEAEDFDAYSDRTGTVALEATSDVGGGQNIAQTEPGEWTAYQFLAGTTQTLIPSLRIATAAADRRLLVRLDGEPLTEDPIVVPTTGGPQTWQTVTLPAVPVTPGQHRIEIHWVNGGVNLNYLEIGLPALDEYRQDFNAFPDGTTSLTDGSGINSTHLGTATRVRNGMLRLTEDDIEDTVAQFQIPPLSMAQLPTTEGFEASFVYFSKAIPNLSFQYGDLSIYFGLLKLSVAVKGQAVPGAGDIAENHGSAPSRVVIRWSLQTGTGRLTVLVDDVVRIPGVIVPGFAPDASSRMSLNAESGKIDIFGFTQLTEIDDVLVRKLLPETRILRHLEGNTDLGTVELLDLLIDGRRVPAYSWFPTLVNDGNAPLNVSSIKLPPDVVNQGWAGGILAPGARRSLVLSHVPRGDGFHRLPVTIHSDATSGVDAAGNLTLEFTSLVPGAPSGGRLVARFPLDADGNSADGLLVASKVEGVHFGEPGARPWTGVSATFNGANSRIQHPWSARLNPVYAADPRFSSSFTLTAWVKAEGTGGYQSILTSRENLDPDSSGYVLYNNSGAAWEFWSGNGSLDGNWQVLAGPAPDLGTWHHVALVYDDRIPTKTLYLDGEPVAQQEYTFIAPNPRQPLTLGAGNDTGDDYFFQGSLDDVSFFQGALTRSEIARVLQGDTAAFEPPQVRRLELASAPDLGTLEVNDGRITGRFTLRNTGDAPLAISEFLLPDGVELDWNGGVLAPQSQREIIMSHAVDRMGGLSWRIRIRSNATSGADADGITNLEFQALVVPPANQGLNRLVYLSRPGLLLDHFYPQPRGVAGFPAGPSEAGTVDQFEAPSDVDEEFGQILYGYLVPRVTGDYTFYMASDDQGELWLSSDDNPANARLIATEPEYHAPREWTSPERRPLVDGRRVNISAPIRLQAGQEYYIEAMAKEATGGDNLGVAWTRDQEAPPAPGAEPIPGEFLRTVSRAVLQGAAPQLRIQRVESGLLLSWFIAPGFHLEQSRRPDPSAAWSVVPHLTTGRRASATVPGEDDGELYFRLRRP